MKLSLSISLTAICIAFNCFAVEAAEKSERVFAADQVVAYKTVSKADGSSDALDLHVFQPTGHQATNKTPCILFFFGGGWNGGSPSQFFPHCEYFAQRGLVAISAEYRTKTSHGVDPRACVFDGKSAVRWVREHAAELGIDPDRIAVGGGSAGGHVAAAVAACQQLEETTEPAQTSCLPNALVLFNPVYDNGPEGYGHDRVKEYWEIFSPRHNIHPAMPPTIAFFGTNDNLIPVATTSSFAAAMKIAGVRYDNHLYEGQPHGFFNFGRSKGADKNYFVQTVQTADQFLASLGFVQGEPTVEHFVRSQPTAASR
jgi:acetyl esterase